MRGGEKRIGGQLTREVPERIRDRTVIKRMLADQPDAVDAIAKVIAARNCWDWEAREVRQSMRESAALYLAAALPAIRFRTAEASLNRETTVPEEAVDILAACMACRDVEIFKELADADPENYDWKRREAKGYLERCLPVIATQLRSEWEAELLSDEAVEAATRSIEFDRDDAARTMRIKSEVIAENALHVALHREDG